jgi:hypothetical protein
VLTDIYRVAIGVLNEMASIDLSSLMELVYQLVPVFFLLIIIGIIKKSGRKL